MTKILVTDPLDASGLEVLQQAGRVDVKVGLSLEQLREVIRGYDALVVRSGTDVNREVIQAADVLKVIGRAGAGVDNIDVDAATERGIYVLNSPSSVTIAAAEHTVALMMALARRVPQACAALKAGGVDRTKFVGLQLAGKTVGILGLGRIGTHVARLCQGLSMSVIGCDPFISIDTTKRLGVELVELDELLRRSDIITVHVPLTKETKHLLGRESLEQLKPGALLINCARGGIVDEQALYECLVSEKVGGAALDVFDPEAGMKEKLLALGNVIATPHLGASTKEAQVDVAVDIAEQVIAVLRGEMPTSAVNLPPISPETLRLLRPFLNLAERLGRLQSQLVVGRVERVDIVYAGQLTEYDTAPLTRAFLKGLMELRLPETVNYVNAPLIARSRGIFYREEKSSEPVDYYNLIKSTTKTNQGERSISGSVFHDTDVRIVSIDGYRIDVAPEGYALIVEQHDRPGIIGRVGTLLGTHDINIAFMQVGRKEVGGHAVMVLAVDSPVPEPLVQQIKTFPNILDVRQVDFGQTMNL